MRFLAAIFLLMFALSAAASEEDDVHERMQEIRSQLISLLPLLYQGSLDHAAFFDGVRQLQSSLSSVSAHFSDEGMSDQVAYETLTRNLKELSLHEAYLTLPTARKMVAQTLGLCTSCHKLDYISKSGQQDDRLNWLDDFTIAELSFVTRDYESAVEAYERFILDNVQFQGRLELALERLLIIQLEILADTQAVSAQFTRFANHDGFTDAERDSFQDWLDVLKKAEAPARFSSVQDMDEYLSNAGSDLLAEFSHEERLVHWLLVRHQLNKFLIDSQFKDDLPITIYWHAVSNRAMQFDFYDAASRGYLEQCVRDFPEHAYAKQCFVEYETLVLDSFASSDRASLPASIRRNLQELEALL